MSFKITSGIEKFPSLEENEQLANICLYKSVSELTASPKLANPDIWKYATQDINTAGSLTFDIIHTTEIPSFKVGNKVAVYLDLEHKTSSATSLISEAIVTNMTKEGDYEFKYSFEVKGYQVTASDTTKEIKRFVFLDYKHTIKQVDKNGTKSYINYFFDNSARKLTGGVDAWASIADKDKYYSGKDSRFAGAMYKSPTYPIIDIFDSSFTHVFENNAMIWVRRKANGGTDNVTFNNTRLGAVKTVAIEDKNYVITAAETRDPGIGRENPNQTGVQKNSNGAIEMSNTTAKFVGWPKADLTFINNELNISNVEPYYFLRPDIGTTEEIDTLTEWESEITYPTATWYVNGAHYVCFPGVTILNGTVTLKQNVDEKWGNHQREDFTYQNKWGYGSELVPGDGNEFYNIHFWRNDGDSTAPAVSVRDRKGLVFDNCVFESTWDGYSGLYDGSPEMAEAIRLVNAYDIRFDKCNFIHHSALKTVATSWVDARATRLSEPRVLGKRGSIYGLQPAFYSEASGNIFLNDCFASNDYGQVCYEFNNTDNVTMELCSAETYYHGSATIGGNTRNIVNRPSGYRFDNNSTSLHLKGCTFYGEGVGFYLLNLDNMVYPVLENCSAISNGDEAYQFTGVKYPKLRNCSGETISDAVYSFNNCVDPILYNCTAESDSGWGYYFINNTKYWRTVDCHVLSGSGLYFQPTSLPGKIDFGTFIQTANQYLDQTSSTSGDERSLVGIKLWDAPYKVTIRNLYFKGVQNDVDIGKGDNVELYLENSHFAGKNEIAGQYSSPAYFIHKGFSGVWEYRDIGGTITTSAVRKEKLDDIIVKNDPSADFSLSFKSNVNNEIGRPSITLGNSNEETQYLELAQGKNRVEVFVMGRLLDVENPITNQDLWLELKYKDRSSGDPHIASATTRAIFSERAPLTEDKAHQDSWVINGSVVPDRKAYKLTLDITCGQKCSCPLTICYEYYTTIGEVYVEPYARVVQLNSLGVEEIRS